MKDVYPVSEVEGLVQEIKLTVSTPAPTTSIATPTTSSGVSSFFVSKYVNNGTTGYAYRRDRKEKTMTNLINIIIYYYMAR